VDKAVKSGQLLGLDYGTDEEEKEEGNQGEIVDPLEPSVIIRDALDSLDIQPKDEEMEDQSALALVQVPEGPTVQSLIDGGKFDNDPKQGLKSTSGNPLLSGSKSSSQSVNGDGDLAPVSAKPSKSSLTPLRQKIAHSDDLFFDLSDISASLIAQSDVQDPHLDLQTLFPDLQPFGLLDVSPSPVITNGETKKRSDKKSDRDDPTKRAEDLNYSKLFPTGRFMQTKPTLIGPLQPAKRFKDDTWLPIDLQAVTADMDGNNRVSEDISNGEFTIWNIIFF
jgi:chromatin modification-related protein VID21